MTTLDGITHRYPDILSGVPVFVGTRVPVRSLFDYLEGGDTSKNFFINSPRLSASKPSPY